MAGGSRKGRGRAREKPGRHARHAGKSAAVDAEQVRAALRGVRQPLTTQRLAARLGVDRRALRGLRRLLVRLEASGGVERSRGRWRLARGDGLVEAVVERIDVLVDMGEGVET